MKITFLGDSLTWGGYGGNFVEEVAKRLLNHEIINSGHGGNTVVNLLRRLDDVLSQEPDAIFVMVGGNDAISYTQPDTRAYYKSIQKLENGPVDPDTFASSYRDLLTQIQAQYVHAMVGLPPIEYSELIIKAMTEYNNIARDIARQLNVPVLDLAAHFTPDTAPSHNPLNLKAIQLIGHRSQSGWHDYENERKRLGYTYTFDGTHLMPGAASKFADLIVPFLREHVL
ncbi:MAG: SGNH/GDSL hydrolase family protein [Anaerolineae bacterium]|nr:SGNH/GDSL hydrolase family protein [Anaerolineae bacterium]